MHGWTFGVWEQDYDWQGIGPANRAIRVKYLIGIMHASRCYTPGRGKIVPRNVTLLVGEKLCRVI